MKRDTKSSFSYIVFTVTLLLFTFHGGGRGFASDAGYCLSCHGKRGLSKTFASGESIELYVDGVRYHDSVHGRLGCSACHDDFTENNHPKRSFRSVKQYRVRSSLSCKRCHGYENLLKSPIHASLLAKEKKGEAAVCSNCHDHHGTTIVTGETVAASEKEYCLRCHAFEISIRFIAEVVAVKVSDADLKKSVHSKLRCSDCHFGFSKEEHPRRVFRTARDFSIASSENCRRCHFDKYTKTLDSVHFDMLSRGMVKAPVCTDCHGAHNIPHFTRDARGRTFIAKKCRKCHPGIYETYAASVHGDALFNEMNQDVPICIDCHTAHQIENPLTLEYHEKIPDMCGNCHSNPSIMGKYGLSTNVVKTYLTDFHGVTLAFYRQQREVLTKPARPIAVCTDCHGTHDIRSIIDTDPAVIKANLLTRCRKCHETASGDFPDAWLFHYEPSAKKYPVLFAVDLAFQVFIPLLIVCFIVQIVLHIWRYAVNR